MSAPRLVACAGCGRKAWPSPDGGLPPGWNLIGAKPHCRRCLVLAAMLSPEAP